MSSLASCHTLQVSSWAIELVRRAGLPGQVDGSKVKVYEVQYVFVEGNQV